MAMRKEKRKTEHNQPTTTMTDGDHDRMIATNKEYSSLYGNGYCCLQQELQDFVVRDLVRTIYSFLSAIVQVMVPRTLCLPYGIHASDVFSITTLVVPMSFAYHSLRHSWIVVGARRKEIGGLRADVLMEMSFDHRSQPITRLAGSPDSKEERPLQDGDALTSAIFSRIHSMIVDPLNGDIFVTDNGVIRCLRMSNQEVVTIQTNFKTDNHTSPCYFTGLCMVPENGTLYACERTRHTIWRLTRPPNVRNCIHFIHWNTAIQVDSHVELHAICVSPDERMLIYSGFWERWHKMLLHRVDIHMDPKVPDIPSYHSKSFIDWYCEFESPSFLFTQDNGDGGGGGGDDPDSEYYDLVAISSSIFTRNRLRILHLFKNKPYSDMNGGFCCLDEIMDPYAIQLLLSGNLQLNVIPSGPHTGIYIWTGQGCFLKITL